MMILAKGFLSCEPILRNHLILDFRCACRWRSMAGDRVLTQEEIDSVFKKMRESATDSPDQKAQPYDFRRPDRIAKDQLRAIHLLHENFARSLASSLSAYLRAYVAVNLVSVEQLSFMEFTQCLPSPTSMIALGMKPFDGNAVLEINPSLVFPILEMLLGGSGKISVRMTREITEIEQSILDGLLRIILQDLRTSWQAVTALEFSIESHETEPQLLHILAPNEAVVSIGVEVRLGDIVGMMNIALPSIVIKMTSLSSLPGPKVCRVIFSSSVSFDRTSIFDGVASHSSSLAQATAVSSTDRNFRNSVFLSLFIS